ncbi:hypothetical protein SOVF_143670, partial [Spinacia oleracea]
DRFVIPDHPEYNKQILKRANKSWRQYKHSLKVTYYKPDEKTLAKMCDAVPRHGISSAQWRKLVKYWASDEGQKLSEYGKAARAAQNQFHRSGCNSYANQQADYAKIEMLKTIDPSKPEQELENAAFEDTMHGGNIHVRPLGYGLGVRKSDVYGVHGVLRKQGYGKVRERTVVMESVKEDVSALSKKNETLEKENGKLQAQVKENSFMLTTLIGQFAQLVGQVRTGTASTESLRLAQEVLSMSHNRVIILISYHLNSVACYYMISYGLGVRKSDVYGVHGVLRKQGYGKVRERTVVMESVKEDVSALSKKNETLEKENGKLQAQVKENSFMLTTLIGQFAQLVGQVRTGTASTESLRLAQEVLSMSHNRIIQRDKGATKE